MADLRSVFESFGVTDVATYSQSGNVLFPSRETDTGRLAGDLDRKFAS